MKKVTNPKANKSHKCTKCGLWICPGDKYIKIEDNDYKNGKFTAEKYHEHCYQRIQERFKYVTVCIFGFLGLVCAAVLAWIMF